MAVRIGSVAGSRFSGCALTPMGSAALGPSALRDCLDTLKKAPLGNTVFFPDFRLDFPAAESIVNWDLAKHL